MSPPTDPERLRLVREALVGRLLPDLVHQLRNPVNSILTGATLLRDSGDQPSLRDTLLPVLVRSAEVMRGLLAQTDEWSGPNSERTFELRGAVRQALALLEIRRHSVVIHQPEPGTRVEIRGNPDLLWMLLLSVLEEAKCRAANELRVEISETPVIAKLTLSHNDIARDAASTISQASRSITLEVARELGCTIVFGEEETQGRAGRTVVTFPKQMDEDSEVEEQ